MKKNILEHQQRLIQSLFGLLDGFTKVRLQKVKLGRTGDVHFSIPAQLETLHPDFVFGKENAQGHISQRMGRWIRTRLASSFNASFWVPWKSRVCKGGGFLSLPAGFDMKIIFDSIDAQMSGPETEMAGDGGGGLISSRSIRLPGT
jgi:hypothetical protein